MTAEVIAPIVAASFTGFLFVVFVVYGLFRPGHTMQQLRWVLGMWFLVAQAIAFGAIANKQGYYTRTTDHVVALWAMPVMWTVTYPVACAMLTCAIFQHMGGRFGPPVLTLGSMLCLALGVLLPLGWSLWYWFMGSLILYAVLCLVMLFGDRMDALHEAVKTKNPSRITSNWPGLVWRLGYLVSLWFFYIMWGLDVWAGGQIPSYNTSLIVYAVYQPIWAIIFVLVVFFLISATGYLPSADLPTTGEDANLKTTSTTQQQQQRKSGYP